MVIMGGAGIVEERGVQRIARELEDDVLDGSVFGRLASCEAVEFVNEGPLVVGPCQFVASF